MKKHIPEAPQPEKIEDTSTEKLLKWLTYFESLSERIKVIRPDDADFVKIFSSLEDSVRILKKLDSTYEVHGWPQKDNVAFIIAINSSRPNQDKTYLMEDVRIFCFNDIAFRPDYFEWDGDGEENYDCNTYSLSHYSKDALSWMYITKLIKSELKDLTETVPEFPS